MNIEKFITLFAWIYGVFTFLTIVSDVVKIWRKGDTGAAGAIRFIILVICISWILSR